MFTLHRRRSDEPDQMEKEPLLSTPYSDVIMAAAKGFADCLWSGHHELRELGVWYLGIKEDGVPYGYITLQPSEERVWRFTAAADMPDAKKDLGTQAMVQIDPSESECLEIRFLKDPAEVVVLRHGMGYPEGGEAVYNELIDPGN